MKTELQKQRDEEAGIYDSRHEFDNKTGKIIATGRLRQVIDPESVVNSVELIKRKKAELEELLKKAQVEVDKIPKEPSVGVKNWVELQIKASEFQRADAMRQQIENRTKELNVLTDDLKEQEAMANEYLEWKKKNK